jgi:hypothetical protein
VTKRSLRNKKKNERKKMKLQICRKKEEAHPCILAEGPTTVKEEPVPALEEPALSNPSNSPDEVRDLRQDLQALQNPGVRFPHDSCSSKGITNELEGFALTQYNLKRGLKEFGEDGVVAVGKEMGQLHTRKVAKPVDANTLTSDQKRATLRYLMFLSNCDVGGSRHAVVPTEESNVRQQTRRMHQPQLCQLNL